MINIQKAISTLYKCSENNKIPEKCSELSALAALEFVDLCDELQEASKILKQYHKDKILLQNRTEALFEIKNMKSPFVGGKTQKYGMSKRMKIIASRALK